MNEKKIFDSPIGMKDYEGPCRETASTMLGRFISQKRRQLAGLEHLLKIAEKLESGSPGEEMLWEILSSSRKYCD